MNLKSFTLLAAGIVLPFICSAQQTVAEECTADSPTSYSRPKVETANMLPAYQFYRALGWQTTGEHLAHGNEILELPVADGGDRMTAAILIGV